MECPICLDSIFSDIVKKHLQVAVVGVNIVDMDHIRLDRFYLGQQLFGITLIFKAVVSQYAGNQGMDLNRSRRCIAHTVGMITFTQRKKDMVFYCLFIQQLADRQYDLAGTAFAAGGIDLYNFHMGHTFLLKKCLQEEKGKIIK